MCWHGSNTGLPVLKEKLGNPQTPTRTWRRLPGQTRIAVDRFALTSNDTTYAASGDAMNYWRFFPVAHDDGSAAAAWGRIPVCGFGTVNESRQGDLSVGERIYGYFPMSTHVDLAPSRVSLSSFIDAAPHRTELHMIYNQPIRCHADRFYTPQTEDIRRCCVRSSSPPGRSTIYLPTTLTSGLPVIPWWSA